MGRRRLSCVAGILSYWSCPIVLEICIIHTVMALLIEEAVSVWHQTYANEEISWFFFFFSRTATFDVLFWFWWRFSSRLLKFSSSDKIIYRLKFRKGYSDRYSIIKKSETENFNTQEKIPSFLNNYTRRYGYRSRCTFFLDFV